MAQETSTETICRYLQDTIAAEDTFEDQLRQFAREVDQTELQALFLKHADETNTQKQRLTQRLTSLGGKPSGAKSFMAKMFGFAPKAAQMGHHESEKATQNLIMAYAVENSEVAMYEALAVAAAAAGDSETEILARSIQDEERRTADRVWQHVGPCARDAFNQVSGADELRMAA